MAMAMVLEDVEMAMIIFILNLNEIGIDEEEYDLLMVILIILLISSHEGRALLLGEGIASNRIAWDH